jgi:hypothetical protein
LNLKRKRKRKNEKKNWSRETQFKEFKRILTTSWNYLAKCQPRKKANHFCNFRTSFNSIYIIKLCWIIKHIKKCF